MQSLPNSRSCFVCGLENPAGLQLKFETDGRVVHGQWTPTHAHVGFKDTVHGGLTATLLDEVMTWVCGVASGRFCYCAEMTVRYRRPLHPGATVRLRAELANDRRGRLLEARAEITDLQGTLLATGTGKYLPVPGRELAPMLDDFIGDCSAVKPAFDAAGKG